MEVMGTPVQRATTSSDVVLGDAPGGGVVQVVLIAKLAQVLVALFIGLNWKLKMAWLWRH
jgi:hypothetical protein